MKIMLSLLICGILLLTENTHACSCIPPLPPLEALEEADAVFSGTVLSMRDRREYIQVQVDVDCAWKGSFERRAVLYTFSDINSCSFPFETGRKYLFYAYFKNVRVNKRILFTDLCQRTKEYSIAGEDIDELGTENCIEE
ncbi:MAG: hypothetical protein E3K37_03955 [Candidatus Kuenenia sp.]|nr:hypothetical protein [Candidatus Kuenenia hertensis]